MLENRLGRELISPCLRLALLASLVGGVADAGATIVTAPLASSQPLINPSAAAYRLANGVFVAAQQTNEQTDALDLTDSTFNVAVGLRTYDFAFFAALGHFHFEFNISQQAGVKNTDSTVTSSTFDSSTHATTNSLNLVPIQVIAAYKFSGWSFGLKRLMTFVNYGSNQNFSIATADALTSVNETATQESDFAVNGIGLTINLFGSNVYVASGVDLIELNSKLDLNGQTSLTQDGKTTRTKVVSSDQTRTNIVKSTYGLGFLRLSPGSDFRAEVDYETMQPLETDASLAPGVLYRATAEATWKLFHLGVEYVQHSGYYVDPNNLVPYFFKFEHLSSESIGEFRVFGGFRWSKGHGIGVSFLESTKDSSERLSNSDPTSYHIERKTQSYGASYSYVY